mmetsp:Transcript_43183/g.101252  ORF Transcript_43183/g.101252 Transcript_43183/m.101252 type:complete len:147 (-) Transcript_43183:263-703(-)|eukprot:CAMPEP_0113298454 /NCGR_PEP_ID=MMETSP0010_2-20120614/894_1 /TAXON_ID=216773 ORGANISM="Corethron hystrix, Strain 308" /NCGR_SAMPLE_ID=MMETSP0010_2 /ASSEMBLY_ACC=CAM_ASM_000155 /LENGTH=146 /DNA_ID=CAMNT_0000151515 /DNA_START=107 /DNA_END=547 /DNA_ORIENTATION=- /assembly_acc=CAM_ASM_000155
MISRTIIFFASILGLASAFTPAKGIFGATRQCLPRTTFIVSTPSVPVSNPLVQPPTTPTSPGRSATALNSLFGLGAPELAIIAVAAAFVLGPAKLGEMSKDLGKMAGELKEVPKEFQAGVNEGEVQAKAMKARSVTPENKEAEEAE